MTVISIVSINAYISYKTIVHFATATDLQSRIPGCQPLPKTKLVLSDFQLYLASKDRKTRESHVDLESSLTSLIQSIPDEKSCGFLDRYLDVYKVDEDYEALDILVAHEFKEGHRYLKMTL
jgi:hypothetical protein